MDTAQSEYVSRFKGSFVSTMRWEQLDQLWDILRGRADLGWHIYAIGEQPPEAPVSGTQLQHFVTQIDELLRREHDEDYCGIVYADDLNEPSFIKIFDPNNLGVSCGYSDNPPLPGWVLSLISPVDLKVALPPPGNRRRWWQKLFSAA